MTILLPSRPLPKSATPRPLDFGAWLTPPLGGEAQRLERAGSRFAMDVTTPNLKPEPDGRIWASRLLQGISGRVRYPFPQPGLKIGAPGAILVDGGSQAGSILAVRGGTPHYAVREGQFFHVETAGQYYLYSATAQVILDAAGAGSVPIWPPLRVNPSDGDACGFGEPMIEGALSGNEKGWTLVIARTQGLSFTITETA